MLALGVVGIRAGVETFAAAAPVGWYWGMYCGPFGAFGLEKGFVRNHARKATSYWGRNRFSAICSPSRSLSR